MNFELFDGNPDKPASESLLDFQKKLENKNTIEGVVENPLTQKQKKERFIQVLSPGKDWQSIDTILKPQIRFAMDKNLQEGQEIEISPMSIIILFKLVSSVFF